jgi:hypothetical protein
VAEEWFIGGPLLKNKIYIVILLELFIGSIVKIPSSLRISLPILSNILIYYFTYYYYFT